MRLITKNLLSSLSGVRVKMAENRDASLIRRSGLFDESWYLAEYSDVAQAGVDPVIHYLRFGFREGREPGPDFDTAYYLSQVSAAGSGKMVPLLHYLKIGKQAGLEPRPVWKAPPPWSQNAMAAGHELSLDSVAQLIDQCRSRSVSAGLTEIAKSKNLKRVLFVIATRAGGTPQTNQDLMAALDGEVECLVLQCSSRTLVLEYFADGIYTKLDHHVLQTPIAPFPHHSKEYDRVVFRWLVEWQIDLVHVRHIAWHGLGLVEMASLHGAPIVFSFHDYYAVCPTVKLLDDCGQFCRGVCTATPGDCRPEDLWPVDAFGRLKRGAIVPWQAQFGKMLEFCNAFVTTTEQVRKIILDRYPELSAKPFPIIPHGRDFGQMVSMANAPDQNLPFRLVVPGDFTKAKGAEIIAQLAEIVDPDEVEIHILGSVSPGFSLPGTVLYHGAYAREDLHARLATIRPHVGAVLSVWPETWSHTLTELWAAGIPVVGFDTGAVGERLRSTGAGWLANEMSANGVMSALDKARRPDEWMRASNAVKAWQTGAGRTGTCHAMSNEYLSLYRSLADRCSSGKPMTGADS